MKKFITHLWFDKQAKEAADFYTSIFPDSKIKSSTIIKDTPSGDTEIVSFELNGQAFMAISAGPMFKFNESISFIIPCESQEEIDKYWEKLSAVPESERCGWCKDKFGLSWQIIPENMEKLIGKNPAKTTPVMLGMKKIIIEDLEKAGE